MKELQPPKYLFQHYCADIGTIADSHGERPCPYTSRSQPPAAAKDDGWRIIRRLLDDIDFDWDAAGNEITAEQAYEYISAVLPIRDSEEPKA